MRIVTNNFVELEKISTGCVFKYQTEYYLKSMSEHSCGDYLCINLINGLVKHFNKDLLVEKIEGRFIVE